MTLQSDHPGGGRGLVTVHLSPHAPGCAGLDLTHPDRWPVLIGLTSDQVLRAFIHRLGVRPHAVHLFAHSDGTVDVHGATPDRPLLAVIFDAPAAALTAAHSALVAAQFKRAA